MRLDFDDVGRGATVLLVHGHPFDRTLWAPQLEALADEFRVVAPDLRGFGRSPLTPGVVTMREYAADVEELLDELGVERPVVVGLSMGGLIAMEMVTADPERYSGIGLVTTTAQPVTAEERSARLHRADRVEQEGMQILIDYMHTGLYGPRCPRSVRDRVDAMMAAAPPAGAAAALRGRAERPDYRPLLARLDLPAFVCTGSADPWSDAAVTQEIVDHLRRPELLVIDGVGHLPNLEAEQQFNEALGTFVRTHSRS